MQQSHIRNFSIIAHIDHGKSTLADRFIQLCGGLEEREMTEQDLEVLPVLNKLDMQNAEPDRVQNEIGEIIGLDASHALRISAKTGHNVPEVLEAVVHQLPAPKGDPAAPLQASIVDSWFDNY